MLNIIKYIYENEHMYRNKLQPGKTRVLILTKPNYNTDNYNEGIIKDILTKSEKHTRGIKVRLQDGTIGRIVRILEY